jgi:FAD:protein FMN transferase
MIDRITADVLTCALAGFDRASKCFSVYDADSELCRWRRVALPGTSTEVSPDLAYLLMISARWQVASGGLYNPSVGVLTERWKIAERADVVPSKVEMAELAGGIGVVPYVVDGQRVIVTSDCSRLSFNALAKGLSIDDVAAELWATFDPEQLTVNVGGDLFAKSAVPAEGTNVGIEHPTVTHVNEPPVKVVRVSTGGLATSASSHRGFMIAGDWFSHLIDPRTGWPIALDETPASVTVIASTAATADVLATVGAICAPSDVVHTIESTARAFDATASLPAVGAVTSDLQWFTNEAFGLCMVPM